ncbi:MAG: hypothetical protein COA79_00055 [Planctomycetota bacterium]|nr:MAG: hypothetical protein COA79_00055 [Planctomycetota bacterium]
MDNPFLELNNISPSQAFDILDELKPQGIAIILYFLPTLHGKLILEKFTPIKRKDILDKIDVLSPVDDEAMGALAKIVQEKLNNPTARVKINGSQIIQKILSNSSNELRHQFTNFLQPTTQVLNDYTPKSNLSFNELSKITNKSFQRLIREVDRKLLLLSIKTESELFKIKLKENSSQGALELLETDLRDFGPAKKSDILKAQNKIANLAMKLSEQGVITLDSEENFI